MPEYEEIESPQEIKRLNAALSAKLKRRLPYAEARTIGHPHGNFKDTVYFRRRNGPNIFWWLGDLFEKRYSYNMFGHGIPGSNASLKSEVEINLPTLRFSRRLGGAFVRHVPTNSILLAHRGIVTLGHGRVRKSALFAEMAATLCEANTSKGISEFLLVSELQSSTLLDDLEGFAVEVRRTVQLLGRKSGERGNIGQRIGSSRKEPSKLGMLRKYFDEFSGKIKLKKRSSTVADCYHGTVVRALRDALINCANPLKNREIDLVACTSKKVFLFEVKTSADSQCIYTAIGQLAVHTPAVKHLMKGIPVERVMVLPTKPARYLNDLVSNELGIRVLIFNRSEQGRITIHGLGTLDGLKVRRRSPRLVLI